MTHPRIYDPPSDAAAAVSQIDAWLESPRVVLLGETEGYWDTLRTTLEGGRISGPLAHDAHIAPA